MARSWLHSFYKRALADYVRFWVLIFVFAFFISNYFQLNLHSDSREEEFTKASSKFLLTDPDLLSQYLSILLPRTSAHSEKGVISLFDCLGEWWKALKEHSIALPESLNIDLLIKCFDILVGLLLVCGWPFKFF